MSPTNGGRAETHKPALRVQVNLHSEMDHVLMEWASEIGRMMGERHPCGRCGDCCRQNNIVILEEDRQEITEFLGLRPIEFRTKYLRRMKGEWFLKHGNPCSFLGEDQRTCTIYPVRPKICRAFPYQTPWFVKGIFDVIRYEPGHAPPFILYMGEGCPCRQSIRERAWAVTMDFLSDEDRMRRASARGAANYRRKSDARGI
jgi:Fe-S-cluster containining protein